MKISWLCKVGRVIDCVKIKSEGLAIVLAFVVILTTFYELDINSNAAAIADNTVVHSYSYYFNGYSEICTVYAHVQEYWKKAQDYNGSYKITNPGLYQIKINGGRSGYSHGITINPNSKDGNNKMNADTCYYPGAQWVIYLQLDEGDNISYSLGCQGTTGWSGAVNNRFDAGLTNGRPSTLSLNGKQIAKAGAGQHTGVKETAVSASTLDSSVIPILDESTGKTYTSYLQRYNFYPMGYIQPSNFGYPSPNYYTNLPACIEIKYIKELDYRVTYNNNNGFGTMDKTVVKQADKKKKFNLAKNTFTREGYDWVNWNISADGSNEVYSDCQSLPGLEKNITLYAQWKPHTYKVNFDANSIKDNDITGSMAATTFTYDITKLPECKYNRIGYTFKCWNTSPDGSGAGKKPNAEGWRASSYSSVTDMLPGDIVNLTPEDGAEVTLYAIWEPITYTVKFHANNGPDVDHGTVGESGVISKTFTYDVSYSVESYGFTNGDIPFSGWNTKSDMTGSHYETELINLASHQGDIVELYAVWDIYNLYYNGHRPTKVYMDNNNIKGLYENGKGREHLYFGH